MTHPMYWQECLGRSINGLTKLCAKFGTELGKTNIKLPRSGGGGLREEFEREGKKLPPKHESQTFESNVITPGTEFMAVLLVALQCYVHQRLNNDPGWKPVKVALIVMLYIEILEHESLSADQNSMKFPDQFQDLRLDIADMSYDELVTLEKLLTSNKLKRVFGVVFYLSQLHFILIDFCSLKTFSHILGLNCNFFK